MGERELRVGRALLEGDASKGEFIIEEEEKRMRDRKDVREIIK